MLQSNTEQALRYDPSIELAKNSNFDPDYEYDDEVYTEYINSFEQNPKKKLFFRFIKRAFDICVSGLALLFLAPFFLLFAIIIKIDDPHGPVFFKQKRMGRNGKVFNCYKFRSMKTTAPHDLATSVFENPDQYYTRFGKIMRKLSIDELPQFWCCFIGTMSIIGPRPLVLSEEKCNSMRLKLGALRLRPGITGYAQVHGRDNVYYKNKALLDAEYCNRATIWFDIRIFFDSIFVVLKRKGNHDNKKQQSSGQAPANNEDVELEAVNN